MHVKNLGEWGGCYGPRERRGDHSEEVNWGPCQRWPKVGVWGLKFGEGEGEGAALMGRQLGGVGGPMAAPLAAWGGDTSAGGGSWER
jgi:hypothetical protein